MGDAAALSRVILGDALPVLRVSVKALAGGLQGVLEAFLLAALGTLSCLKLTIELVCFFGGRSSGRRIT